MKVKIVTPDDGSSWGTKVTLEDGTHIPHVTEIAVKIIAGNAVTATLTLATTSAEVWAHALFTPETLNAAAREMGYKLVAIT